jgi:hypothetical protein
MTVIPAMWKARIRRTVVPGQSGEKGFREPISMEKSWQGGVCHHSSYGGKKEIGGSGSRQIWAKIKTIFRITRTKIKTVSRISRTKRAGGKDQMLKYLPGKHEA